MPEPHRTNLVFILTDDQGPWAMGCAGNEEIRTPNLDRLAASGTRFENFFCASPVCSPARASILTGRIPSAHGVHDWIRERNMPPRPVAYLDGIAGYTDVLGAGGYALGLSGKWHLGDSLTPQKGFDHWFCLPSGGSRYQDAEMIRDGEVVTVPGYLTDRITDDAIEFLENHADGPFCLSLHYNAPHSPWTGHPDEIVRSYDDCPFKSCPQEAAHPNTRPHIRTWFGNRENLKGYFAAVTGLDIGVGRVLDKLEELGLREDTLVVFMSDNGFSCGQRGIWGKGNGTFPPNMFENSVKVPALFSQPGRIPAGKVSPALTSQYDFLPTLLEYLDLPGVEETSQLEADLLPGRSFLPALMGESDQADRDVVICDEYGPTRMIRTPEWKYVHRYPYGLHELYDLDADPRERSNLVDEKSTQGVVTELRGRLARWFGRYSEPVRDGSRLPVTGCGQVERIDQTRCGEGCFTGRPGE